MAQSEVRYSALSGVVRLFLNAGFAEAGTASGLGLRCGECFFTVSIFISAGASSLAYVVEDWL
jgi:hypothetical protein